MPTYPPIPAGKGVPLVDLTSNLFDSAAVMAALDARYGQSGNAAGLFSAIPTFGQEGRTYYATDQNVRYLDTGAAWMIAPGQLLASGSFAASVSGAGALAGRIKTAVNIPAGQKLIIAAGPMAVFNATAVNVATQLRALDTGADVASGTGAQIGLNRTPVPAGSIATSSPGFNSLYQAVTGGAVSAGVFMANATGSSATDAWWLMIVSAS